MREALPLPSVGDRIKLDYGAGNINTWREFGVVRAIIDGNIIVRRWSRRWKCHQLSIIDPGAWWAGGENYIIQPCGLRTETGKDDNRGSVEQPHEGVK